MRSADDLATLLDAVPRGLLIGGEWRAAERTFDVRDPFDGAVLAAVADGTDEDALDAWFVRDRPDVPRHRARHNCPHDGA